MEVTVFSAGGQAREIELNRKVQLFSGRQILQQIDNLERRAAGDHRHGLGDLDFATDYLPAARHLHLHAVGGAADFGVVDSGDEVAEIGRFASHQLVERGSFAIEV